MLCCSGYLLLCNEHLKAGWLHVQDGFFTYVSGISLLLYLASFHRVAWTFNLAVCDSKSQQPDRLVQGHTQKCHSITCILLVRAVVYPIQIFLGGREEEGYSFHLLMGEYQQSSIAYVGDNCGHLWKLQFLWREFGEHYVFIFLFLGIFSTRMFVGLSLFLSLKLYYYIFLTLLYFNCMLTAESKTAVFKFIMIKSSALPSFSPFLYSRSNHFYFF